MDETAKIGVAGDSAGGTISASLARDIKGIDFQVKSCLNILKFICFRSLDPHLCRLGSLSSITILSRIFCTNISSSTGFIGLVLDTIRFRKGNSLRSSND